MKSHENQKKSTFKWHRTIRFTWRQYSKWRRRNWTRFFRFPKSSNGDLCPLRPLFNFSRWVFTIHYTYWNTSWILRQINWWKLPLVNDCTDNFGNSFTLWRSSVRNQIVKIVQCEAYFCPGLVSQWYFIWSVCPMAPIFSQILPQMEKYIFLQVLLLCLSSEENSKIMTIV